MHSARREPWQSNIRAFFAPAEPSTCQEPAPEEDQGVHCCAATVTAQKRKHQGPWDGATANDAAATVTLNGRKKAKGGKAAPAERLRTLLDGNTKAVEDLKCVTAKSACNQACLLKSFNSSMHMHPHESSFFRQY